MRAVVITLIVVVVLFFLGWLRFSNPGGNPTLQVDTAEIKEDTGEMVERGKAAVERVQAELNVEDKGDDEAPEEEVRREPSEGEPAPSLEPRAQ